MFTPDHARPAQEMLRVAKPGGRIGLANWTPEGFIGQLFKVIGAYLPPPAGLKSPALWGTEPHIVSLFGSRPFSTVTRSAFDGKCMPTSLYVDEEVPVEGRPPT